MAKKNENADDTEAGLAEVQEKVDQETEQGFVGVEVDPIPNEEYSVQTGPDSPTIAEQQKALAEKLAKEERHPTGNAL
jgi:hypothetical protein